jgi:hypothetical protein
MFHFSLHVILIYHIRSAPLKPRCVAGVLLPKHWLRGLQDIHNAGSLHPSEQQVLSAVPQVTFRSHNDGVAIVL